MRPFAVEVKLKVPQGPRSGGNQPQQNPTRLRNMLANPLLENFCQGRVKPFIQRIPLHTRDGRQCQKPVQVALLGQMGHHCHESRNHTYRLTANPAPEWLHCCSRGPDQLFASTPQERDPKIA